ncbi:GNAT family N-acetyltransferase [Fredinandcohnia sp. 179-A 10B2 NHS]|uniref:GNAT family N-acetyltransferase n=1 Tax=Fredinandcohnia sp. 179-A 10B2 NHS TaxID=3235176 RepID=UPI00399F944F
MRIRDYQEKDENGWIRCRVLAFLNTAYHDNVLQKKEKYEYPAIELVAEIDNLIVGILDIEVEDNPGQVCSNSETRSGMIWHIAIHPDYQRSGIAASLLKEAEQRLHKQGVHRLEAWTRDDKWVNDWYEKHGFSKGKSYLHVYLEGKEHEEIVESKLPDLKPIYTFAHYTGDQQEEIKAKYQRVHECNMYEKHL